MSLTDPADQLKNVLESGRAIKLSRGVIGKTGHIALSVILLWAIIVSRWSENLVLDAGLLLVGILASVFAVWWTRSSQVFAERNPAQAMLEGADFKLEIQQKDGGVYTPGDPVLLDSSTAVEGK